MTAPLPADDAMRRLVQAAAAGGLGELLEQEPSLVTVEVAAAAEDDARAGSHAGRSDVLLLASAVAAAVHLRLGDRVAAVRCQLQVCGARFLLAEDAATYLEVRSDALDLGWRAWEVSAPRSVLAAWTTAADCSWFASTTVPFASTEQRDLLLQAMRDTADALDAAQPLTDDPEVAGRMAALASLLGAVSDAAPQTPWADDQLLVAHALMRRLASGADHLPLDLDFSARGGAPAQARVAAALQRLEDGFGAGATA